jgi:pimeloyl-ACP methyl ester carboxylesterase
MLWDLARWLGPWADESRTPEVERRTLEVSGERGFPARLFAPKGRAATGSLLLVQGLHYLGPDDPRLDRFAAIVANAGVLVLAPCLPDFAELRVRPTLMEDTARAFDLLESLDERPAGRPGVFAISFGSLPALRLAASESHRDRVGSLVVFGGYADFGDAIRFCLEGEPGHPHDPLNRPAVYLNFLDFLEDKPDDTGPLEEAWLDFVRATWGRPEMKARARYEKVARDLAEGLDDDEARRLFLLGCGGEEGGVELGKRAVARAAGRLDWLDARPHLGGVRCPVHLVHGRDDDVIPWTHAEELRRAFPHTAGVHKHITGLYAHTGQTGLLDLIKMAPAAAGEVRAMMGILRAIREAVTRT